MDFMNMPTSDSIDTYWTVIEVEPEPENACSSNEMPKPKAKSKAKSAGTTTTGESQFVYFDPLWTSMPIVLHTRLDCPQLTQANP